MNITLYLENGNIYLYAIHFVSKVITKWQQQLPYYYSTGLNFHINFKKNTLFLSVK